MAHERPFYFIFLFCFVKFSIDVYFMFWLRHGKFVDLNRKALYVTRFFIVNGNGKKYHSRRLLGFS